jgi:anaerobic magnesium-protoporphyrin IX monomethyl ester cyclase
MKVLFLYPNKWGRGITPIWVASHNGVLKKNEFQTDIFDCTFFSKWSDMEIDINTNNNQFKHSNYLNKIKYNENNILDSLQKKINDFEPNIIFFSAISSHIHGEGEYININYGNQLIEKISTKALIIAGGIQSTASPTEILNAMPKIDVLIMGESEIVLKNICNLLSENKSFESELGIAYRKNNKHQINKPQKILNNLDCISPYDYSIFDDQSFLRPYNGNVVRAIDYEISRGCIYTCSYCVETIIQKYYGFNENNNNGALKNFKNYRRNKSAKIAFQEIKFLNENLGIKIFRCQDTNFLTIESKMLSELANLIKQSKLDIKLYIETRAEGINDKSIQLLKDLKVDGVGMGIELSDQKYRQKFLNRFIDENRIISAFNKLRENGINRTAYNIIGLPDQTEESIIDTIKFNIKLDPDVSSVAYYSIYKGTSLEEVAKINFSEDDKFDMDAQIRGKIKNHKLSMKLLDFYKLNFSKLIKAKLENINQLKKKFGI